LQPLRYAFHWKHGDTRALIPAMRGLASEAVDFSKALALRRSGASSSQRSCGRRVNRNSDPARKQA
jgi:hypothetical protein